MFQVFLNFCLLSSKSQESYFNDLSFTCRQCSGSVIRFPVLSDDVYEVCCLHSVPRLSW